MNASGIATLNPIRYRSYYYDTETGLYYLNSRYYDPEIGRFVNGDGFAATGQGVLGNNMFAYCGNNPVNRADSSGQFWIIVVAAVVGIVCSLTGCSEKNSANSSVSTQPYKPPAYIPPTSVSDNGANFIASYEGGASLTPYNDAYGNPTIGYGHLIKEGESFSSITEEEALTLFKSDLSGFEKTVSNYMNKNGLQWNQNQFDAMVSVAYNGGAGAFYSIAENLMVGWDPEAAFTWYYTREKAHNGNADLGLWRRRMDECAIFAYGTYLREDRKP